MTESQIAKKKRNPNPKSVATFHDKRRLSVAFDGGLYYDLGFNILGSALEEHTGKKHNIYWYTKLFRRARMKK